MAMHQYPTRWRLARHTPPPSASQAGRVENTALVKCKRRRKRGGHILLLPDEILFQILLFVPPEVLHDVVRYVCKHWKHIVDDPIFISAHHESSTTRGFLLQDPKKLLHSYYFQGETQLKVTNVHLPFHSRVMGSRNGLVLLHDCTGKKDLLHVVNPVTRAKISLPPLKGLDDQDGAWATCFAVASSGHYKVVHITGEDGSRLVRMRVFTVGVDKVWRFIDLHGIHIETTVEYVFPCRPCVAHKKWVYWYSISSFFGFALNIDDETVYQFHKPEDYIYDLNDSQFIRLGTCLGAVQTNGDRWKVWILTDIISGRWTELVEFRNMSRVLDRVGKCVFPRWGGPGGFICPLRLVNGYLWFYHHGDHDDFALVRYNVDNQSFRVFMIRTLLQSIVLHPHVPTLLSPRTCFTTPSRLSNMK